MKHKYAYIFICLLGAMVPHLSAMTEEWCVLKSPDGLNAITVSLGEDGRVSYRVERGGRLLVADSALGIRCEDQDFSQRLVLKEVGPSETRHERYQLMSGNNRNIDAALNCRTLTLVNDKQSKLNIDLVASNDGVAWRYRLTEDDAPVRVVVEEMTGFRVPTSAVAWLQPYHAAGKYTPAYEDFYFKGSPGAQPPVSRDKPRGWCLPALFEVPSAQGWVLITESGTDGSYCGCHLEVEGTGYKIGLAYEDEATSAKSFDNSARPAPVQTRMTPWRVVLAVDQAGDLLTSTLITDLAAPCQIEDVSWIQTGRASWAWWSHPDDKNTVALFNSFTDLAADFGWEYTLFDAGWWSVDTGAIGKHAVDKGVKTLAWTHASDFYDARRRARKLDEFVAMGASGIKVDFWCSDRQNAMAAMQETLKETAQRKLTVNFHGCTIPRGWHRTWPNLLTAEAVLGTESYFYESRYPEKVAELNTILPFTRNLMAPMDYTPVAVTIRKYPRQTTAAHEIATAMVFNSGIIHYADSVETFGGFPREVKEVLREAPAAWDKTVCLMGEPGKAIVLARKTGTKWFVAGLNGAQTARPVALDLTRLGTIIEGIQIAEGQESRMQFAVGTVSNTGNWQHTLPGFGGFVLMLQMAD